MTWRRCYLIAEEEELEHANTDVEEDNEKGDGVLATEIAMSKEEEASVEDLDLPQWDLISGNSIQMQKEIDQSHW